jgi:hypothetical protein
MQDVIGRFRMPARFLIPQDRSARAEVVSA